MFNQEKITDMIERYDRGADFYFMFIREDSSVHFPRTLV